MSVCMAGVRGGCEYVWPGCSGRPQPPRNCGLARELGDEDTDRGK